jgi:ketosteroid isomerase-like protein
MAEHRNAELVRRAYEAFQRGDLDALRNYVTPDIKYHVPGRNQTAGDFQGVNAVLDSFRRVAELSGGSYRVELHEVLANGQHVVALARQFASHGGKSLDDIYSHVFHFQDDKISESWVLFYDPYQNDEFFGPG